MATHSEPSGQLSHPLNSYMVNQFISRGAVAALTELAFKVARRRRRKERERETRATYLNWEDLSNLVQMDTRTHTHTNWPPTSAEEASFVSDVLDSKKDHIDAADTMTQPDSANVS